MNEEETLQKIRNSIHFFSEEDEYGVVDWFEIERTINNLTDEIQSELFSYAYKYAEEQDIGIRM